jgi:RsiW-degrading membrane proteinase PrsW (M82 family)
MVVAALGFAAVENIIYLFSPIDQISLQEILKWTLGVSFVRFIGATFLHTLCSAVIGYTLAMSFCQNNKKLLWLGIFSATLLHGLYDFSIITLEGDIKIIVPVIIILILAFLVFLGFEELKKMKGLCKIN